MAKVYLIHTGPILYTSSEDANMDAVKLTLPIFIRLLEYAKEDAKTDMDLHFVAEYVARHGEEKPLTMKDYTKIIEYVNKGGA